MAHAWGVAVGAPHTTHAPPRARPAADQQLGRLTTVLIGCIRSTRWQAYKELTGNREWACVSGKRESGIDQELENISRFGAGEGIRTLDPNLGKVPQVFR